MSNHLAIATVTAGFAELLLPALRRAVMDAKVTTRRPDAPVGLSPEPRVNLYLYSVTPNAAWRNADVPLRRADGGLMQRAQTGLDLQYLLTFYGDESQLQPQRLLAADSRRAGTAPAALAGPDSHAHPQRSGPDRHLSLPGGVRPGRPGGNGALCAHRPQPGGAVEALVGLLPDDLLALDGLPGIGRADRAGRRRAPARAACARFRRLRGPVPTRADRGSVSSRGPGPACHPRQQPRPARHATAG